MFLLGAEDMAQCWEHALFSRRIRVRFPGDLSPIASEAIYSHIHVPFPTELKTMKINLSKKFVFVIRYLRKSFFKNLKKILSATTSNIILTCHTHFLYRDNYIYRKTWFPYCLRALRRQTRVPLVLSGLLACPDDWPISRRVKCITVGAGERSAARF